MEVVLLVQQLPPQRRDMLPGLRAIAVQQLRPGRQIPQRPDHKPAALPPHQNGSDQML